MAGQGQGESGEDPDSTWASEPDMLKAGLGQGEGEGRAAEATYRVGRAQTGASPGLSLLPWEGAQRGLGARRPAQWAGPHTQSLPSAAA